MKKASERQRLETTGVLALATLVVGLAADLPQAQLVAVAILLFGLLLRRPSAWLASAWLSLAALLGRAMGALLLSVIYLLTVAPAALLARLLGRTAAPFDPRRRRQDSLYVVREHDFGPGDLEHPW